MNDEPDDGRPGSKIAEFMHQKQIDKFIIYLL